MSNVPLEQIDWHICETECLLDIVTFIAELEDEERDRLRPGAITVLYLMGDKLRSARRAVSASYRAKAYDA